MSDTMKGHMTGNTVWLGLMGLIWAGFLLLFSCAPEPVFAGHITDLPKPGMQKAERTDIACFFSDEKLATLTQLDAKVGKRKGHDYIVVFYSLDGGEKANVAMLYRFFNGHINPVPTVYVFGDIMNNGVIQVYLDRTGDGRCNSITIEPENEREQPS